MATQVKAQSPCNHSQISQAVTYLINAQPHPFQGNQEKINEISEAICSASTAYPSVDPWLFLAMGWFESHFLPKILDLEHLGQRGEKGGWQVGRQAAKMCKQDLKSIKSQALCAAFWFDLGYQFCKKPNTTEALNVYATGKCNGKPGAKRPVDARKKLAKKLKEEFEK